MLPALLSQVESLSALLTHIQPHWPPKRNRLRLQTLPAARFIVEPAKGHECTAPSLIQTICALDGRQLGRAGRLAADDELECPPFGGDGLLESARRSGQTEAGWSRARPLQRTRSPQACNRTGIPNGTLAVNLLRGRLPPSTLSHLVHRGAGWAGGGCRLRVERPHRSRLEPLRCSTVTLSKRLALISVPPQVFFFFFTFDSVIAPPLQSDWLKGWRLYPSRAMRGSVASHTAAVAGGPFESRPTGG